MNDEDKRKFVENIKKDLNIHSFYNEKDIKLSYDFSNFEDIFEELFSNKDKRYKKTLNDICMLFKINKMEAKNGCRKSIKIIRNEYDKIANQFKKRKVNVEINIPKEIQDGQSLIIYGEGNQDSNLNRGNLIVKIKLT